MGLWTVYGVVGAMAVVYGAMAWWASNPQWSAREAIVALFASAGDRESGRQAGGRLPVDGAVRRPVAAVPRARTIAAPTSLRGRDGRPTRAVAAVLGACVGAILAAAYLSPQATYPLGGQLGPVGGSHGRIGRARRVGEQTQGSLDQHLRRGSIDVASRETRREGAQRVLPPSYRVYRVSGLMVPGPHAVLPQGRMQQVFRTMSSRLGTVCGSTDQDAGSKWHLTGWGWQEKAEEFHEVGWEKPLSYLYYLIYIYIYTRGCER